MTLPRDFSLTFFKEGFLIASEGQKEVEENIKTNQ